MFTFIKNALSTYLANVKNTAQMSGRRAILLQNNSTTLEEIVVIMQVRHLFIYHL